MTESSGMDGATGGVDTKAATGRSKATQDQGNRERASIRKILLCTVCANDSRFEARTADADLYRCPACDHCFADLDSIAEPEQYGSDYFHRVHRNWFRHPDFALYRRIGQRILRHNPNASIIDLGCGTGSLLKYLRGLSPSWQLYGIDLSRNQPAEGIEFIQGDVYATELSRRFDVVTSLAVIEHLFDLDSFVRRIERLCLPGGLVIITTVNERGVVYGVARAAGKLGFRAPRDRLYSKHHVNHFNLSSLRRLLERNHLRVIEVLRHNPPMAAVDFEASSPLAAAILRTGVRGTFILGRLTGGAFLQTVTCRSEADPDG